jgi:hypothetical protein
MLYDAAVKVVWGTAKKELCKDRISHHTKKKYCRAMFSMFSGWFGSIAN